jgi:hypothetical protein
METETIQKNGASPKSLMSRGNFLSVLTAGALLAMCFFVTGCEKEEEGSSSELVGTWQSVGYYNGSSNGNYYPGITTAPISDTSERITFKSNGKGVYAANGSEKEFDWKENDGGISINISMASSIHNTDNWNYSDREYHLSSTELVIFWSSKAQYVYNKIQ